MILDIEQRQLLRSISNLVVRHPEHVKTALRMRERGQDNSVIFVNLEPVFSVVESANLDLKERDQYIKDLKAAIAKISDPDIKNFLSNSVP